jgi:Plasmid pRiA4b ORF-3-like protein
MMSSEGSWIGGCDDRANCCLELAGSVCQTVGMSPSGKTPATKPRNLKAPGTNSPEEDLFNQICTVRIELVDTNPVIWREVEVPTSVTLKVLHDIIQITLGWFDRHLWEFTIGNQKYGSPTAGDWGAPRTNATKVRLRDVLTPPRTTIDYLYDFGDSWEHRLTVTKVRPGEPGVSYPRYVGGEWAGPPEDCGGIPGFYNVLDAMADPEHPNHAEIMEWLDGYDPKEIEEHRVNFTLGGIANRRSAGRIRRKKQEN